VKILPAVIICLIGAATLPAQTAVPARPSHGLVVLELTWSRETRANAYSPPVDNVPPRTRRDDPHADPVDKLRGPSPIRNPLPAPSTYVYVYSLKIRNESGKIVRGVYWEYVASDRDNGAELNRRRLINIQKVGRGEVVTIHTEYPSPPTNIVTPEGLGKDERSPFTSSAEIRCVLYADGTAWQAEGGEEQCAELRQADARVHGPKGRQP
jgi:hypothetical protein